MEEKKRRGYSTIEKQMEANKRYYANNPEARERRKIGNYRSNAKTFINNHATREELLMLKELIESKLKE